MKGDAQENRDILRIIFDTVYVNVEKATVRGAGLKPAYLVFFGTGDKEKDIAQLWKVGVNDRTHWTKARVYLLSGLVRCDARGEPPVSEPQ